MPQYKKLDFIKRSNGEHWVGDGFPVRNIFSYNDIASKISPFLLLDYAGPAHFDPSNTRRGVGAHPHRGFETVTIVYQGEVEHRDSGGGGGKIGPGDVQWMTAASGIVHEEFHGTEYSKRGGPFEMVQLWVNLPARDKSAPPRYQSIRRSQIPVVSLPEESGSIRVIAGEYDGAVGPAQPFTPMHVYDVRLGKGRSAELKVTSGFTTALMVLKGRIALPEGESINEAELAVMERNGDLLAIEAIEESSLLLLSGQPIDEPIVGYGPFVMNSADEIRQAFLDYKSGRMGTI